MKAEFILKFNQLINVIDSATDETTSQFFLPKHIFDPPTSRENVVFEKSGQMLMFILWMK